MKTFRFPKKDTWPELIRRPQLELDFLESAVKNILHRVETGGDQALVTLTEQFDGVSLSSLMVTRQEIETASQRLSADLKAAIQIATTNISTFHEAQRQNFAKVETSPGVSCWRKAVAIEKVGIYIPGGSAPLFSSVLMLGIPAKLAGCKEVILCTPPRKDGSIDDAILHAANLVGVSKIYKAGGAQAIGALAFGTETIPSVSKIFGPGNQYVTKAKQLVNLSGTAIDLPAGPSEVLVIADAQADPAFVAADLLSQAEHGADSQVVLVTNDESLITRVDQQINEQIGRLPRAAIAQESLRHSLVILLSSPEEIVSFVNAYAPEHVIINTDDCDRLGEMIINAGSVFLGPYSPESAGDYASGTNHTLPTNGFAKAYGGVSMESFMKYITFQRITVDGLKTLGPVIEKMAEAEQLLGHKESISIRLKKIK
jgi:histidinol dehydrogenase